jgi:hypothetical protein
MDAIAVQQEELRKAKAAAAQADSDAWRAEQAARDARDGPR